MKDLRKKNKDEENALRDKKGRDEAMLKDIIDQYDEMMETKEVEIRDLEVTEIWSLIVADRFLD